MLDSPCPEWTPAALRGWLGGSEAVAAVRGPEDAGAGFERARVAAEPWLGRRGDGLLPLIEVAVHEGRVVWIYPRIPTLALAHLRGPADGDLLPARAAAEVVGRLASILVGLGAEHPGPEPADVLVTPDGDLRLLGFVGPFPPTPEARAPLKGAGAPAQVYRLGVLLARLLTGTAPTTGSDRESHQARLRRVVVRAMARPGASLPERYRDWLLGMLAWEPELRPPLSAIPGGLSEAAVAATGPGLREWATGQVATRIALFHLAAEAPADAPVDELPSPRSEESPAVREFTVGRTAPRLEGLDLPPMDDDPTAEAEANVHYPGESAAQPGMPLEAGSIPVLVGPPPEAHRGRPKLSIPKAKDRRSRSSSLPAGARGWLAVGLVITLALTLLYGLILGLAVW